MTPRTCFICGCIFVLLAMFFNSLAVNMFLEGLDLFLLFSGAAALFATLFAADLIWDAFHPDEKKAEKAAE